MRRLAAALRTSRLHTPIRILAQLRHTYSPRGRFEARFGRFSAGTTQRLDGLAARLGRVQAQQAELMARVAVLDKRCAVMGDGVQELSRRVGPPSSGPRTLVTNVIEENVVLAALQFEGAQPRVVLVLNGLAANAIFAGVRTALITGVELARRLGRPLAVVVLEPLRADPDEAREELARWIHDEFGAGDVLAGLTLSSQERTRRTDVHRDDIWIVTYWTTAVQIGRRVDRGELDADHVVYLVQDWEPAFYAWGSEYALARGTYDRGYHLLVNSSPLAAYVAERTQRAIAPEQVIAPQVDAARLTLAAKEWRPAPPETPRVLFYARPSKPRNTYALGLAALRLWADALPEGIRPVVTFAGEAMAVPELGTQVRVRTPGKLSFEGYYELLSETDAGLALMHSPHPSHPALELPMAGIATVTNALEGYRKPWVEGLRIAPATPEDIAAGLAACLRAGAGAQEHRFTDLAEPLGNPLGACLDALVARLPPAAVRTH